MGGTYSVTGSGSGYAVADGVGRVTMPTAGLTRSAVLGEVSSANVDIRTRFSLDKLPSAGSGWVYGVVRSVSGGEYRVKARLQHDGAVFVSASRVLAGRESMIATETRLDGDLPSRPRMDAQRPRHRHFAGGSRRQRVARRGLESGRMAVRRFGQHASLQGGGAAGLRVYVSSAASNAPFTFEFADYSATAAGTSPNPPSPTPTPTPIADADAHRLTPTPRFRHRRQRRFQRRLRHRPRTPVARHWRPRPGQHRLLRRIQPLQPSPTPTPTVPPTPTPTPAPTPNTGNSFYVATNGNDSNPGTFSAPWRTLQKAADAVPRGRDRLRPRRHVLRFHHASFRNHRAHRPRSPATTMRCRSSTAVTRSIYTVRLSGVQHVDSEWHHGPGRLCRSANRRRRAGREQLERHCSKQPVAQQQGLRRSIAELD